MRPIKFRAWDKEEKRMWWNVQNAYDTGGNHSTPDPNVNGPYFGAESFGELLRTDKYIVMQFTGLHDKNGKEIYEGDIIVDEKYKPIGANNFHVVFDETEAGFRLADGLQNYFLGKYPMESFGEVIGNIFENPLGIAATK